MCFTFSSRCRDSPYESWAMLPRVPQMSQISVNRIITLLNCCKPGLCLFNRKTQCFLNESDCFFLAVAVSMLLVQLGSAVKMTWFNSNNSYFQCTVKTVKTKGLKKNRKAKTHTHILYVLHIYIYIYVLHSVHIQTEVDAYF